jgi:hypothetical protein
MTDNLLRRSQVLTSFGPGALVDLPRHAVIIGGLNTWTTAGRTEIAEPRLTEKLKDLLDLPGLRLFTPPAHDEQGGRHRPNIVARIFPTWFVVQEVVHSGPNRQWRRRRLLRFQDLTRGKFVDDGKRKRVVPVRFVVACPKGHIDDLDWRAFVHKGAACERPLWLEERGTSGDISDTVAGCECGQERRLSEAASTASMALGSCAGKRPWLGPYAYENCGVPNRLLVRAASNTYFAQILSVISLPEQDQGIVAKVASVYDDFLSEVQSAAEVKYERRKPKVAAALEGFLDEAVMAEILRRRHGSGAGDDRPIKQVEFEVLDSGRPEMGGDAPESRFFMETPPRAAWDPNGSKLLAPIERIGLVHRLTEVIAQIGFTRFESAAPDIKGELDLAVERAALDIAPTWLPAVEMRGEGIFVSFKRPMIEAWLARKAVQERRADLMRGFLAWQKEHPKAKRQFFDAPYILLHSLSHLLITAIALECGYPASSLRERIYAFDDMYGILIFTGSSDADGTLGGLVENGRRIAAHLEAAVASATLCSNDPVCAEHQPSNEHEARFLYGAACHGCLLIAETSCEMRNDFLDRALVVPTVSVPDAAFFRP